MPGLLIPCRTILDAASAYLDQIDGLIVTGGVSTSTRRCLARRAASERHDRRTAFELAAAKGALKAPPVLGFAAAAP